MASKTYTAFLDALGQRESGGNYNAENQFGYLGKYQFGELALRDIGYYTYDGTSANDWKPGFWTGKNGVDSKAEFLANHSAQESAIRAYMTLQWQYMKKAWAYEGQVLNGVKITESGMLAGAHWAYVELGWGGYWAWDPVENTALLPWLAVTLFLHAARRVGRVCGGSAPGDDGRRAFLMERCRPGTTLAELRIDPKPVVAHLLPRLWVEPLPDHPFRLIADEADRWAVEVQGAYERAGRPFEHALVAAALEVLRTCDGEAGTLVDQDLHPGNVLAAEREPFLVIDPKPAIGERELSWVGLHRNAAVAPTSVGVIGSGSGELRCVYSIMLPMNPIALAAREAHGPAEMLFTRAPNSRPASNASVRVSDSSAALAEDMPPP